MSGRRASSVDAASHATEHAGTLGPGTGSSRHVGEEVSGGSQRRPGWAGSWDLGREPEVREDLADDLGVLDAPPDVQWEIVKYIKFGGQSCVRAPRLMSR